MWSLNWASRTISDSCTTAYEGSTNVMKGVSNEFKFQLPSLSFQKLVFYPAPTSSYTVESFTYDDNTKINLFPKKIEGKLNPIQIPYLRVYTQELRQFQKCALYFHGNGDDLGRIAEMLSLYMKFLQMPIFAIEYPSYGCHPDKSKQQISNRIKKESLQFYEFIKQSYNKEEIIVIGQSIGTGPACYLSSMKNSVQKLILISPFQSIKSLASEYSRFGTVVKNYYNNSERIREFRGKLLIIHGQKDRLIPISQAKKLEAEYNNTKLIQQEAEFNNTKLKQQSQKNFEFCQNLANQPLKERRTKCVTHFPKWMTHNDYDLYEDILHPIRNFLNQK